MSALDECRLISLPRIDRPQGALTPVEGGVTIPFEIQRVYYLYDIVHGATRGGHAHRNLPQLIVCTMGRFEVVLDDGRHQRRVELSSPDEGLYVPRMIWRELEGFSSGAICVVLASLPYDEADYIRDRDEYLTARGALDAG